MPANPKHAELKGPKSKYRRVLLKVSGEALMGEREYGLDPATLERVAQEVMAVHEKGVEI